MNGKTFIDNAKLESTIGPVGCTVVRPMRTYTTMYKAAPIETMFTSVSGRDDTCELYGSVRHDG